MRHENILKGLWFYVLVWTCNAWVQIQLNHINSMMVNHVIDSKTVTSISVCVYDCMVLANCQSFNYDMDTNMCEINSEDSQTAPEDIISTQRKMMFSDIKAWPKSIAKQCAEYQCASGERCVPGNPPICIPVKLRCPKLKTKVTSSRLIGSTVTLPGSCPCGRSGEYSVICRDNLRWEEVGTSCNYSEPLKDGWSQYGNSCYYFGKTDANWADSQTYCEGLGGYLAEINNANENSYLWDKVKNLQGKFWIGGTDKTTENLWIWDSSKTQITSSWQAWYPGEPSNSGNEDCLEILSRVQGWNDKSCYVQQKYICEVELK